MLSKTSKLDGIKSWSLQAVDTCPARFRFVDGKATDQLAAACAGCYATAGNYRFKNVKAVRERNADDWQSVDWSDRMVDALSGEEYFRWLDSGDIYSIELASKVLDVMRRTPTVKHWIPTRMGHFAKFKTVLADMAALPNVVVRHSVDSDERGLLGSNESIVFDPTQVLPAGVKACEAYQNDGKCNGCRACWSKAVPTVGYPVHGQKKGRIIQLLKVA